MYKLTHKECVAMENLYDNITQLKTMNYANLARCSRERRLWRSVVQQAMNDLFITKGRTAELLHSAKALAWFSLSNRDFLWVCSMAELDPTLIVNNVKILHRYRKSIKERKRSKRQLQQRPLAPSIPQSPALPSPQ